jgi:hypothetical protein
MNRNTLKIAEPCSERWAEMDGDDKRRFCDRCTKHVHNLSAMTRQEARALLKASKGGETPCVTYAFGPDDRIVFADTPKPVAPVRPTAFRPVPRRQASGLKRLIATAALVPMLAILPACDTPPPTQPSEIHQPAERTMLDEIVEGEERFVAELRDLFGFTPEYEVLAGEPMVEDWEAIEDLEQTEDIADVDVTQELEDDVRDDEVTAVEPEPKTEPVTEPLPEPIVPTGIDREEQIAMGMIGELPEDF